MKQIIIVMVAVLLLTGCTFPIEEMCVDHSGISIKDVGNGSYELEEGQIKFTVAECHKPMTQEEIEELVMMQG